MLGFVVTFTPTGRSIEGTVVDKILHRDTGYVTHHYVIVENGTSEIFIVNPTDIDKVVSTPTKLF